MWLLSTVLQQRCGPGEGRQDLCLVRVSRTSLVFFIIVFVHKRSHGVHMHLADAYDQEPELTLFNNLLKEVAARKRLQSSTQLVLCYHLLARQWYYTLHLAGLSNRSECGALRAPTRTSQSEQCALIGHVFAHGNQGKTTVCTEGLTQHNSVLVAAELQSSDSE